jgi:hypothetical protein
MNWKRKTAELPNTSSSTDTLVPLLSITDYRQQHWYYVTKNTVGVKYNLLLSWTGRHVNWHKCADVSGQPANAIITFVD